MTRKEDIKLTARKYCFDDYTAMLSFITGAEWADETMIEKACKWLKEQSCCGYIEDTDVNEFIKRFKQAMQEA